MSLAPPPVELYRRMLLIRRFEEKIESLYQTDVMRTPVHSCIGQEAIAVGVASRLRAEDVLFSNYRGHGHYLAKGGDLSALVNELHNRATGCSGGRGGSMHLIDVAHGMLGTTAIVGQGVPLAVGSALASRLRGDDLVTVTFFGDGAAEEGYVYESLNFAAVHALPTLFVCENNGYAILAPLAERAATPSVIDRFSGVGLLGLRADGNDVEAVADVTDTALAAVRGGRPVLLELTTMLMREHVGTGLRAKQRVLGAEWDSWSERCPVATHRERLLSRGDATAAELGELDVAIRREVDCAFERALAEPYPPPAAVGELVYR
jgi:TPP-dependent pyruvate/acetoin dehydrogenase alpha subunit